MTRSEVKAFKEVHGTKALKEARAAERNEKRTKRAEKAREKQILAENRKRSIRTGVGIFKVFLLLCLFTATIRFFVFPNEPFYVESLLSLFESVEPINVSWIYQNLTITQNWGLFNFLRDFINLFVGFLSYIGSIGNAVATIIQFVFRLLGYVYGVG